MATITAGTPDTRTTHSPALSMAGLAVAMGAPAVIALAGIAQFGLGAISWAGAIVWGVVATALFTLFSLMGKAMGMTRMDLLDLLGSVFVRPHTPASRGVGLVIHHMNGALLAIAWAYGAALLAAPANWLTGLVWGILLWILALLMMTTLGGVHPAIRRGEEEDPGAAAMNFGRMTPLGSLMGHLVYGLALGLLYQTWPLG